MEDVEKKLAKAVILLAKTMPLLDRSKRIIGGQSSIPHLIETELENLRVSIDSFIDEVAEDEPNEEQGEQQ